MKIEDSTIAIVKKTNKVIITCFCCRSLIVKCCQFDMALNLHLYLSVKRMWQCILCILYQIKTMKNNCNKQEIDNKLEVSDL